MRLVLDRGLLIGQDRSRRTRRGDRCRLSSERLELPLRLVPIGLQFLAPGVLGFDCLHRLGDRALRVGLAGLGGGGGERGLLFGGLRGGRTVGLFVASLLQPGDRLLLIFAQLIDDRGAIEDRTGISREIGSHRSLTVALGVQTPDEPVEVGLRERNCPGSAL